jgi:hypothetical protein
VTLEINKPELAALIAELQENGVNLDELLFHSLNALKPSPGGEFKRRGQPAEASARLALATLLQFVATFRIARQSRNAGKHRFKRWVKADPPAPESQTPSLVRRRNHS